MRARSLLIVTAVVSSLLGAIVVYLVLTVPNDLQAGALLRQARSDIAARHNDKARVALGRIIQQFPRTDAAAAATVALAELQNQERAATQRDIERMRRDMQTQAAALKELQGGLETLRNTPPPAPVVQKPEPPKPAVRHTTRPQSRAKSRHRRRR